MDWATFPLDQLTVDQLKVELRGHNLPVSGRKADLINRLRALPPTEGPHTPRALQILQTTHRLQPQPIFQPQPQIQPQPIFQPPVFQPQPQPQPQRPAPQQADMQKLTVKDLEAELREIKKNYPINITGTKQEKITRLLNYWQQMGTQPVTLPLRQALGYIIAPMPPPVQPQIYTRPGGPIQPIIAQPAPQPRMPTQVQPRMPTQVQPPAETIYTPNEYLRLTPQEKANVPMATIKANLTTYDLYQGLGDSDAVLRQRLDQYMRNPQLYKDYTGHQYYERQGQRCCTGQESVLGEGRLNVKARLPDEPVGQLPELPTFTPMATPADFTSNKYCAGQYQTDISELEPLDKLYKANPQAVYVTPEKQCWYLPSVLQKWESSFSLYDPQSGRVEPQYPSDYDSSILAPAIIRDVWARAVQIDPTTPQKYPLLASLITDATLLDDLYMFIKGYDALTQAYCNAPEDVQADPAAPNRRDIQAMAWLQEIYLRNFLPNYGGRKYQDIISSKCSGGTQVFYQCVLTDFFHNKAKFRVVHDGPDDNGQPINLRWVKEPGDCQFIRYGNPCRTCVREYLVDRP